MRTPSLSSVSWPSAWPGRGDDLPAVAARRRRRRGPAPRTGRMNGCTSSSLLEQLLGHLLRNPVAAGTTPRAPPIHSSLVHTRRRLLGVEPPLHDPRAGELAHVLRRPEVVGVEVREEDRRHRPVERGELGSPELGARRAGRGRCRRACSRPRRAAGSSARARAAIGSGIVTRRRPPGSSSISDSTADRLRTRSLPARLAYAMNNDFLISLVLFGPMETDIRPLVGDGRSRDADAHPRCSA